MSALPEDARAALATDDAAVEAGWARLSAWIEQRFGRGAGLEAVLFLIGVQSQGRGFEPRLKKEAKQDLIMEGTCCAFETLGLYRRVANEEGWRWERTASAPPTLSVEEQEKLLRVAVLRYFESVLPPADAAPADPA